MGKLFGTDGIRGIVGENLTVELAFHTGQAIAAVLKEEKGRAPLITIGKDTRISSDMLESALICGICSVASSLCLMFAHSLAMFYIAYVLLAVGFGATNCCHPVAVQETYGSKYAGGIFGICMLGYMIICTFISPKISSALVKATGSYTASMIYAIIACIIAVAVYTTIPMPKRRTLAEVAAEEKAAQEKAAQA